MAYRRERIALDQIDGFLSRLKALPIQAAQQTPTEILELPALAQVRGLTNYDAAYLARSQSDSTCLLPQQTKIFALPLHLWASPWHRAFPLIKGS
jgi:predicted nucleic acid-binding protein